MSATMAERRETLMHLGANTDVQVLVIGGGVNGAGLFRELALQGVNVLLVDKGDFSSGASASLTRMIHGGLRYLEFGEFALVRESVKERNQLLRNAPHYVSPLLTSMPMYSWLAGSMGPIRSFLRLPGKRSNRRGAAIVKLGLTLYDIYTGRDRPLPKHRFRSRKQTLNERPCLDPRVVCTATYYDAWISYPERLVLELLLDGEAACAQARALNYVSVAATQGDTVCLRDETTGETLNIRPQIVVNATGGWIDFTNQALGLEMKMMDGAKGGHLVLDHPELLEALMGEMVYYENEDGRVGVVFPWVGKIILGSTDIRVGNPDDVRCEEDEVDYMLSAISEVFPGLDINRSHIVSRFTGVRPLGRSSEDQTVSVSRAHRCEVIPPDSARAFPIIAMIGGKWTTFRAFGEQTTDTILEQLGAPRRKGTEDLPIGGGVGFPRSDRAKHEWVASLAHRTGMDAGRIETLLGRYGTRAQSVSEFCAQERDEALRHHAAYTRREIEFILRHERVIRLADLVLRRTAMALLGEVSRPLLEELVGIMASLWDWSEAEVEAELAGAVEVLRDRFGIEA